MHDSVGMQETFLHMGVSCLTSRNIPTIYRFDIELEYMLNNYHCKIYVYMSPKNVNTYSAFHLI